MTRKLLGALPLPAPEAVESAETEAGSTGGHESGPRRREALALSEEATGCASAQEPEGERTSLAVPSVSALPAPEATRAGEPVAWVVTRKDGSVRSAYVRKSAAESDCDLLNTPCGIDSTLVLEARPYRVVPLYAHPTPPRAEGVERLESSIRAWHLEKYGHDAVLAPTVRHLGEEFGEFCEAAIKGDVAAMTEEAADVALILTNIVRAVGGGSLFQAMVSKHEVCKQRLAAERAQAAGGGGRALDGAAGRSA